MAIEVGSRYVVRAVGPREVAVKRIDTTGTNYVEVLCEIQKGAVGERVRWRGYLNSPANAEKTLEELRVMGWRGARLGDWSGLGSVDFQVLIMADAGDNGRTYYRAAFPTRVATLGDKGRVAAVDLDALNERLGFSKPSDAEPSQGAFDHEEEAF